MLVRRSSSTYRAVLGAWLLLLLGGCNTTPLMVVSFDADAPGSAPGPVQTLGTIAFDEGAGSVRVVESPPAGASTTRWVHLSHPTAETPPTSLRALMTAPAGDGAFIVNAFLYVPTGATTATIQLEPFGQPESSYVAFLRIELLADGTLRVAGSQGGSGQYPHDQVFALRIELTMNASGATARVIPSGENTSGSVDVVIPAPGLAQHFGTVRLWIEAPHASELYVDDIRVLELGP